MQVAAQAETSLDEVLMSVPRRLPMARPAAAAAMVNDGAPSSSNDRVDGLSEAGDLDLDEVPRCCFHV